MEGHRVCSSLNCLFEGEKLVSPLQGPGRFFFFNMRGLRVPGDSGPLREFAPLPRLIGSTVSSPDGFKTEEACSLSPQLIGTEDVISLNKVQFQDSSVTF